jgi:hypothetical protein
MKIGVCDCRVPPDRDETANLDVQFRKENDVAEVTVIANAQSSVLADREVNPIQRAMRTDAQAVSVLTVVSLERELACNRGAIAYDDVGRQFAVEPPSGGVTRRLGHLATSRAAP